MWEFIVLFPFETSGAVYFGYESELTSVHTNHDVLDMGLRLRIRPELSLLVCIVHAELPLTLAIKYCWNICI